MACVSGQPAAAGSGNEITVLYIHLAIEQPHLLRTEGLVSKSFRPRERIAPDMDLAAINRTEADPWTTARPAVRTADTRAVAR